MTRKINLIVVHCSATTSGKSLSSGRLNAAQVIDAWHAKRDFKRTAAKGFNPQLGSIGYHFVIDTDGHVYTGRGLDEVGAHVAGFNSSSIGICMVGGVERDGRYTPAQWESLRNLVAEQSTALGVPLKPTSSAATGPAPGVCGHRDFSPDTNHDGKVSPGEWLKTCPGFDVATWLSRNMVPEQRNVFLPEVAS